MDIGGLGLNEVKYIVEGSPHYFVERKSILARFSSQSAELSLSMAIVK